MAWYGIMDSCVPYAANCTDEDLNWRIREPTVLSKSYVCSVHCCGGNDWFMCHCSLHNYIPLYFLYKSKHPFAQSYVCVRAGMLVSLAACLVCVTFWWCEWNLVYCQLISHMNWNLNFNFKAFLLGYTSLLTGMKSVSLCNNDQC